MEEKLLPKAGVHQMEMNSASLNYDPVSHTWYQMPFAQYKWEYGRKKESVK